MNQGFVITFIDRLGQSRQEFRAVRDAAIRVAETADKARYITVSVVPGWWIKLEEPAKEN